MTGDDLVDIDGMDKHAREEARERITNAAIAGGWKIRRVKHCQTSVYVLISRDRQGLMIRISDHPPHRQRQTIELVRVENHQAANGVVRRLLHHMHEKLPPLRLHGHMRHHQKTRRWKARKKSKNQRELPENRQDW